MRKEKIPLDEAEKEVELVSQRLALLHLTYSKTITEELGEERGKELILKTIKKYGKIIGKRRREEIEEKGMEATAENFSEGNVLRIPKFGMHTDLETNEKGNMELYGCTMGNFWKEEGEEELGKLYCYVDPAKYMGYNEKYIQIHEKAISAGDEYCEFCVRQSTKKERGLFETADDDFDDIDECLK
ncbi:MAG: L-2-amino-thiazoline-4-carboxylic acid hydrolase [Thermoplasmatota archaeon]